MAVVFGSPVGPGGAGAGTGGTSPTPGNSGPNGSGGSGGTAKRPLGSILGASATDVPGTTAER